MDELERLVKFIHNEYNTLNEKWKNQDQYTSLNMKKTRVEDIYLNDKILDYVYEYIAFLKTNTMDMEFMSNEMKKLGINSKVNNRIKALNSIQLKIEKYKNSPEKGKIPINKCLNDLLGFRIICNKDINYQDVLKLKQEKFPFLKCINAKRGEYRAIHIYFGKEDNKNFQWELQVWNKCMERSNLISHAKHKQEYIKWEKK